MLSYSFLHPFCEHMNVLTFVYFSFVIIFSFLSLHRKHRLINDDVENLVKPCCAEPVLLLGALLASISGWLGQHYLPLKV